LTNPLHGFAKQAANQKQHDDLRDEERLRRCHSGFSRGRQGCIGRRNTVVQNSVVSLEKIKRRISHLYEILISRPRMRLP
jgi:hypothetical protein